ncbi:MAG: acetyl/propionyl/methylcrotonyl-CoA carboxylase subunit alpha [Maricaulaceae bacterium]
MKKITKILIANRGEIACRVIKTARKMGIATVAVYSDADRKALHVRLADEAVHIGPSPAVESYLVMEKLIAAAKETGSDAVHPGYGFLSENPDFVRACDKAGLIFIGPRPESMEAMGLKDAAKKLMDAAGVPITPGYHGKDQDPKLLKAKAGMIGYPVLIKAVAGGGGKGMRKVERAEDFLDDLASCQREAKSSFGNQDVLIEKYITSPRHIEVQVFGDTHGNVVHMFERDCSLQRRHQKVIEEAPAPGMTDVVRKAMTDAAVNAAKAVNYVGAGTVEFIVDGSGKLKKDGFWFMEMNTRLQVEHPVTEMITGLDLVELQIRVAQGEKLPKQKEIKMQGHAVEARLYAEDPANDFLPSIGTISIGANFADWGTNDSERHRIDSGVEEGDRITPFYDPMIAKIIGFGDNRESAIHQCSVGIMSTNIDGITCNGQFLFNCLNHDDFEAGNVSTGFIENHQDILIWPDLLQLDAIYALAGAHYFSGTPDQLIDDKPSPSLKSIPTPFDDKTGWKNNIPSRERVWFIRNGNSIEVEFIESGDTYITVSLNDTFIQIHDADAPYPIQDIETILHHRGSWHFLTLDDGVLIQKEASGIFVPFFHTVDATSKSSADSLTAPMPGKIIAVKTKVGASVKAGDPLIIMEAMKMEMTLEAPRDGIVESLTVETGALVADGDILLELEKVETPKA